MFISITCLYQLHVSIDYMKSSIHVFIKHMYLYNTCNHQIHASIYQIHDFFNVEL